MARRPDLPCADCGTLMWSGTTSLPEGQARCRPCRRANPIRSATQAGRYDYRTPCLECGQPSFGNRCRACADMAQRIRPDDDPRVARWQRERDAVGLNGKARAKLLAEWKCQGRECNYCSERATTIDHVIPLARGGTNYEGNLVPCCRRCNSSKAAKLIVEWRHGKPAARTHATGGTWTVRPAKVRPLRFGKQATLFALADIRRQPKATPARMCEECNTVFGNRSLLSKYCTEQCARRAQKRRWRATDSGRAIRRAQKAKARARRRQDPPGTPSHAA